jgi:hypothetical protein
MIHVLQGKSDVLYPEQSYSGFRNLAVSRLNMPGVPSSSVQTSRITSAKVHDTSRQNSKVNQFKRMFRLVFIILLLNTITIIPYVLFYALYQLSVKGAELGIQISAVLIMINSSCNIFKYVAGDKMFREQLRKLFKSN